MAATLQATSGYLARLCFRLAHHAVAVHPAEIVVNGRDGEVRLRRAEVGRVSASRGLLWDTLHIERRDGHGGPIRVRGLRHDSAAILSNGWAAWGVVPAASAAAHAFRRLLERDAYFNRAALSAWQTMAAELPGRLPEAFDALPLPDAEKRDLTDCRRFLADAEQLVDERNDAFVRGKKHEHAQWFATAGGRYGLTDEQQEAILRDEDNCLVIAGAGTGKTSTVAGKVGYLLRTGAAQPEQILLLSFTRKAATEMSERIAQAVGETAARRVAVRTFHGLGVDIIAHADGARPSLSKFAEDSRALDVALARYVKALFNDPDTRTDVVDFFAYHQFPYRSPFECVSRHEYSQYVRGHDLRTLRGERVKSHEELMIANWLHLNGIPYDYERPYPHDTASIRYRQYKPDFYLPAVDVYLEHFGVDLQNNTAPWVDRQDYVKGMTWKRALHKRWGTRLLETYSYQRMEGSLLNALEQQLRAVGVTPRPLPAEAVLANAEEQMLIEPVAKLLSTFLSLFKGNRWTFEELEASARASDHPGQRAHRDGRADAFLRVFRHVRQCYEADLATAREIDFNDMIALATERTQAGQFISPFTHVIVDESQDLSRGRALLLKALLAQVVDRRLFCVGDDWQSIYRFTGSDIRQMTRFTEVFGFTRQCYLTETHRFSAELCAASSDFIQRNEKQIPKTLVTKRALGAQPIEIHALEEGEGPDELTDRILVRINEYAAKECRVTGDSAGQRPSVLVLGRYNFTKPVGWASLVEKHPTLALEYLTVHRAKGLEADYVVLLAVNAGRMGFPSEVVDDPVLDLVLAGADACPNAEERRLFYVALTRAKNRCFVLTNTARRSTFIEELEGASYEAWVVPADGGTVSLQCATCGGGKLHRRRGQHGVFWGCSNFPVCEGNARLCDKCREGALVQDGAIFRCTSPSCRHFAPLCPSCSQGALVQRQGPRGRFLGCSEWRAPGQGPSCTFTRPL